MFWVIRCWCVEVIHAFTNWAPGYRGWTAFIPMFRLLSLSHPLVHGTKRSQDPSAFSQNRTIGAAFFLSFSELCTQLYSWKPWKSFMFVSWVALAMWHSSSTVTFFEYWHFAEYSIANMFSTHCVKCQIRIKKRASYFSLVPFPQAPLNCTCTCYG